MALVLTAAVAWPVFAQPGSGSQGAHANAPTAGKGMMRDRMSRYIYGYQLMTPQERIEYRAKMRSLKTPQERGAFRARHHEEMRKRAAARGVTLPERPMNRGRGPGPRSAPPANSPGAPDKNPGSGKS